MLRIRIFGVFLVFSMLLLVTSVPAGAQGAPGAGGKKDKEEKKLTPKERRKIQDAQLKDIREKIQMLAGLIRSVNEALKIRVSEMKVFDRKQALENQLRDIITLFALTGQAMIEADRLEQEVQEIRKRSFSGPRDVRRLHLANFLDARRREYILFATR